MLTSLKYCQNPLWIQLESPGDLQYELLTQIACIGPGYGNVLKVPQMILM